MNATSLTNEVKRQIKNFNDGCAHELSETIEQVKMALNDRSSDGKSFVISDKSIRRKLKYHYEKAVAAIQASMNLENELGDDGVVQILINKLKNQMTCFKEGITNSLPETIEQVKMALDKRGSDGKYLITNRSFRQSLRYQNGKAIKAIRASIETVNSQNSSDISCENKPRQYYREDVDKFGDKWQNTFTFYSCSYCLYSGPRTDFKKIDDCDPYTKLLYKTIKDEYFSKLRLSRIHQIIKAADVIEVQLNADGSFPGTISSIYFLYL